MTIWINLAKSRLRDSELYLPPSVRGYPREISGT